MSELISDPEMSPDAERPQPVHEADRRVDVGAWDLVVHGARSGLVPAEVHAVEVEVVLEEELVDECGQDLRMRDPDDCTVVQSITKAPNWQDCPKHVESERWARARLEELKQQSRATTAAAASASTVNDQD